tara:strand:+ start:720 stop:1067 length:348 start_codon:yes stop_codon:yes gene_type:complete
MLDYYGSILKDENQIDQELVQHFKSYNEDHILGIINELRRVGTLTVGNSISGWNIFVRHYIIGEIKNILEKETLLAKQKLAFMKFYESLGNSDYDIPLLISNQINPEIIIPKEEV